MVYVRAWLRLCGGLLWAIIKGIPVMVLLAAPVGIIEVVYGDGAAWALIGGYALAATFVLAWLDVRRQSRHEP